MSDQVLYRKYRSARFDEVVGQAPIVATLTAALASGRTSHAYLFTGPRGTGKTSVARLLARALNCTGDPKPCNQCANCLAALNSSLDVIEIDAASNRSIDAVRDLKDKIALAPTSGAYKIYIIDEVHMLTAEAFNALLKTLEEPPAHAVFVLATTEAHKLPDTIISRTQRFNFKPINSTDMAAHLRTIANAEKIALEPDALELIAAAARGSFRDGISLLDQLAGASSPISADSVRRLLGYSPTADIARLSLAMASRDTKNALEILGGLEAAGAQPGQTATQLTEYWRTLLLCASGAGPAPDPTAAELATMITPAQAARVVAALLDVTRSHWPQLALETTVVALTAADDEPAASAPNTTPKSTPAAAPKPQAKTPRQPNPAPTPPALDPVQPTAQPIDADAAARQLSPELWPKVLVLLKSRNNSLYALLKMYPADFGDGQITIKPRFNFHRDLFLKPGNLRLIEGASANVYGQPVKIFARTDETAPGQRPKTDSVTELVSSAIEILGGEVVE